MSALPDLPRFFATAWTVGAIATLDAEETKHAKVLRLSAGDEVHVMDGRGRLALGRIEKVKPSCQVLILEVVVEMPQNTSPFTLAVAPTKNMNRLEWVVEKSTEIGVDAVVPILCFHSERKHLNIDRLQRIALSAAKQSKSLWIPKISEMTPLDSALEVDASKRWIAHCMDGKDKAPITKLMDAKGSSMVLIGPEGDFSPEEVELALKAGFQSIDLGEKRLRTETAAIVAALTATVLRNESLKFEA